MQRYTGSGTVELRSTTAAVAVAAFTMGLAAAYGPSETAQPLPQAPRPDVRPGAAKEECGPLVECASERECYNRIAACLAGGGEWRGDDRSGRCRPYHR